MHRPAKPPAWSFDSDTSASAGGAAAAADAALLGGGGGGGSAQLGAAAPLPPAVVPVAMAAQQEQRECFERVHERSGLALSCFERASVFGDLHPEPTQPRLDLRLRLLRRCCEGQREREQQREC